MAIPETVTLEEAATKVIAIKTIAGFTRVRSEGRALLSPKPMDIYKSIFCWPPVLTLDLRWDFRQIQGIIYPSDHTIQDPHPQQPCSRTRTHKCSIFSAICSVHSLFTTPSLAMMIV
jgi:hypothetical protein